MGEPRAKLIRGKNTDYSRFVLIILFSEIRISWASFLIYIDYWLVLAY